MTMRDIPRAEWDAVLDKFVRERRNKPVQSRQGVPLLTTRKTASPPREFGGLGQRTGATSWRSR
jgi:hypothetical protein